MKKVHSTGSVCYTDEEYRLHRTDGPAVILPDGEKQWYLHGMLHNKQGPAIASPGHPPSWYIRNKKMTFQEWLKYTTLSNEEITLLQLKYSKTD